MKSFRCGKVDTKDINATLQELDKAFREQAVRNTTCLSNMKAAYDVLTNYDKQLDNYISNMIYYITYFTTIAEKNGV